MPRSPRVEYPHAFYHIMNRGRNKDNIFHDKSDFQLFLNILGSAIEKVPLVKVKSNLVPFSSTFFSTYFNAS